MANRAVPGKPAARLGILSASLRVRFLFAAVAALVFLGSTSCSYLKWRKAKSEQRSQLAKTPGDLALAKEYAPQDCFMLVGHVEIPAEQKEPLLAAAFAHDTRQFVGARITATMNYYSVLLPGSVYDLVFFADLNHDGYYESSEVVGRTPPDAPVVVNEKQSMDGIGVEAPKVSIDLGRPSSLDTAFRFKVDLHPRVVESVDDPLFAPEMGDLGVYQPTQLLAKTQGWFFSIGTPDLKKTQVVLVHGINGTPRDFGTMIKSIDKSRYQIWLFYYPSGLRLDQLGIVLARGIEKVTKDPTMADVRFVIVAHSMGGLVGRRAVNELCKSGKPKGLLLYASFDTPYGGIESVAGAVKRGTELVPSWVDVAAGSPFLKHLYETPMPKDLPFYLFFGWGDASSHGPSPAGDGTITLPSQLDPNVQAGATRMMGYGGTHVGILSDPDALRELSRVLDATTGTGAGKATS